MFQLLVNHSVGLLNSTHPSGHTEEIKHTVRPLIPTYLDREAWRQAQGDEVTQLGKVRIGNSHEVYDGRHLLGQRQRVTLTQPQCRFKPGQKADGWTV